MEAIQELTSQGKFVLNMYHLVGVAVPQKERNNKTTFIIRFILCCRHSVPIKFIWKKSTKQIIPKIKTCGKQKCNYLKVIIDKILNSQSEI